MSGTDLTAGDGFGIPSESLGIAGDGLGIAGDSLGIPSVPNIRDAGGQRTRSGRPVRTGLLYRSGGLHALDDRDMPAFVRLGIRSVYDLRGERERLSQPDRLPEGVESVSLDVLAGWTDGSPERFFAWFDDARAAREGLGDGRAEALWTEQYRKFVTLPSAQEAYGTLFRSVAHAANRPALFHCSGGKDRSGWAAAVLLLLLDVPLELVIADYLRSRAYLEPLARGMRDALAARGVDPELFAPVFGVDRVHLEAGLEELRRSFGSIEAYFADGLGVDEATQAALRAAFVG